MARKENFSVVNRGSVSKEAKTVLPTVKRVMNSNLGAVEAVKSDVLDQLALLGSPSVPAALDVMGIAQSQGGGDIKLLELIDRDDGLDMFRDMLIAIRGEGIHETADVLRKIVSANLLGTAEDSSTKWYELKGGVEKRKDKALAALGLRRELVEVPEIKRALETALWFAEGALLADSMVKRVEGNLKKIDERNSSESKMANKISEQAAKSVEERDGSWEKLQVVIKEAEKEALSMLGNDPGQIGVERFKNAARILEERSKQTKKHSAAIGSLINDGVKMASLLDGVGDDEDVRAAFLLLHIGAGKLFLTCLRGVSTSLAGIKIGMTGAITLKMAMVNGALTESVRILREKNQNFIRQEVLLLSEEDGEKENSPEKIVEGKFVEKR